MVDDEICWFFLTYISYTVVAKAIRTFGICNKFL